MPGTRSSAATKCISDVPGLQKQVSTPLFSRVWTRLSAPFMGGSFRDRERPAELARPEGGLATVAASRASGNRAIILLPDRSPAATGMCSFRRRTTNLHATRTDRCRIDRIVMDFKLGGRPRRSWRRCRQYPATLPVTAHSRGCRPSARPCGNSAAGPAGPGSLDGYQGNTELHRVYTEFHGVGIMALRAEPALARSAQFNLLRETPCKLCATPCSLEALAARGKEQPMA